MAENDGDNNVENAGGNEGGGELPARPDYIPESFWDAESGAPKIEDLGKAYSDLSARHAKGKDALRESIAADLTTEIEAKLRPEIETKLKSELAVSKVPASPNDYTVEFPEDSPVRKMLDEANMVILTETPADDFILEDGKSYFLADPADPMLKFWKGFAHEHGLSQDQFLEGLAKYANVQGQLQPKAEDYEAQRQATYKELGEHGQDRYSFARSRLVGVLGEDAAKTLWPETATPSKAGIEAMEKLLSLAGQPSFSPTYHAIGAKDIGELDAEAKRLMAEKDYYSDPEKQARVSEIYRRITEKESRGKAA